MKEDNNIKIISEKQAYERMARICSRREYAPYDISQKLYRLKLPQEQIERIIGNLKKNRYLDEERYVRSYVNDKLVYNKWGPRKIEQGLLQKRIPRELINEVLSEYESSELNDNLQQVLSKKWKGIKGASEYEKKGKLIRYALGRGFEMKEILCCMEKMNIGEVDFD
ncbi:MAG: regulatory protein RecX [Fermentimonas sp.]|jgi:regulatory protein